MAEVLESIPLTAREAISGVLGSVSLACWIFLLVPQLIENYKCGSAEAISLTFLGVWFVGDVTNLSGAAWAQLVPTIIAIAVYFCIADGVMIAQCVYYNVKNARKVARKASLLRDDGVEEPLLGAQRRTSTENMGLPGSRRRSSAVADSRRSSHRSQDGVLGKILEEQSGSRESLKNAVSVLAICAIGAAGWTIAWQSGAWKPTTETKDGEGEPMPVGAEVLGYLSAVCYLGARIPQIIKNYRDKSCEGLSLLFFILSLLGNATYGAGILFHSTEKEYFIANLPWLIGSLGTMVEDVAIFVQFRIYSKRPEANSAVI